MICWLPICLRSHSDHPRLSIELQLLQRDGIQRAHYRQRPIPDVVREFQSIREKRVLVVDDNLVGTRPEHIARAKDLFRALARANLRKEWIAQATINFADDEELLALAAKAGCSGVFIGFESPHRKGFGSSARNSTF